MNKKLKRKLKKTSNLKKIPSKSLEKDLIKVRKIIKEKFQNLKKHRLEANRKIEGKLKPLVEPLKSIAESVSKQPLVKSERMETIKEQPPDVIVGDDGGKPNNKSDSVFLENSNYERGVSFSPPLFLNTEFVAGDTSPVLTTDDVKAQYETTEGRELIDSNLQFIDPLPRKYIKLLITDTTNIIDHTYGVRHEPTTGDWKIGNKTLELDGADIIIDDEKIPGTEGLYNLIFMKQPDKELYNSSDLQRYGKLLRLTSAHKRGWRDDAQINGNRSYKYEIIRRLFPIADRARSRYSSSSSVSTSGKGLMSLPEKAQHYTIAPIKYVYFNSINEIVDRLRLLYAEKNAGNSSHMIENEINSILEELKESKVIS